MMLCFSRSVRPVHHGCHGKAIASIFQSVILHYQRTTSQHVRAMRNPNYPKLHTLVPHLISRCTRSAHATATDRRKTEIGKLAAELRGLTFLDDLPEARCQLTIVTGKHLIQVPLGPDRRLQSPLFTLRGFGFVLLCFRFKISHEWCYSTQYTYNLR